VGTASGAASAARPASMMHWLGGGPKDFDELMAEIDGELEGVRPGPSGAMGSRDGSLEAGPQGQAPLTSAVLSPAVLIFLDSGRFRKSAKVLAAGLRAGHPGGGGGRGGSWTWPRARWCSRRCPMLWG